MKIATSKLRNEITVREVEGCVAGDTIECADGVFRIRALSQWGPPELVPLDTPEEIEARRRADLARLSRRMLTDTDYVESKARRQSRTISPAWDAWRDKLADIAGGSGEPIPPEPPRWADKSEPQDPPEQAGFSLPDPQQEIDALKDQLAEAMAELARRDAHNFPENLTDKLSDWDTVQDEASLTTADLTEEVIQKLTKAKRKKFTELLNVELAELQQERGGPREDLKRENEIEALLGLFARVGEM